MQSLVIFSSHGSLYNTDNKPLTMEHIFLFVWVCHLSTVLSWILSWKLIYRFKIIVSQLFLSSCPVEQSTITFIVNVFMTFGYNITYITQYSVDISVSIKHWHKQDNQMSLESHGILNSVSLRSKTGTFTSKQWAQIRMTVSIATTHWHPPRRLTHTTHKTTSALIHLCWSSAKVASYNHFWPTKITYRLHYYLWTD